MASAAQIELLDVSKSFPTRAGERLAIDRVTLSVAQGETATVIGPTGCGKTTLLNLVAGFIQPTRGRVLTGGMPVTDPGPDRGFMFQRPTLLPWLTVFDNVAFPCRHGKGLSGPDTESGIRMAVLDYLERVGLADARDLFPPPAFRRHAITRCARPAAGRPEHGAADGRALCCARCSDPPVDAATAQTGGLC